MAQKVRKVRTTCVSGWVLLSAATHPLTQVVLTHSLNCVTPNLNISHAQHVAPDGANRDCITFASYKHVVPPGLLKQLLGRME